MRLLIVEDEPRMAGIIAKGLREQSYAVDIAKDGAEALNAVEMNGYDLIILDIMIPVKNGYEVCGEIRRKGIETPVLFLTARDSVEDRVKGLDCGADDYLMKPFDFKELLARVRALLRRAKTVRKDLLESADLVLDTNSHAVARAGRNIELTAKEYALLEYFMLNEGKVITRRDISEHVWDENFDMFTNLIDVYVRRLRTKIGDAQEKLLIHTRRGEGYLFGSAKRDNDV